MSFVVSILLSFMVCTDAFYASRSVVSHKYQTTMHFEESVVGNTALSYDAMKRERYVAINRFTGNEYFVCFTDKSVDLRSLFSY